MRSRGNKALLPLTAVAVGALLAFGGAPVQAATVGPGPETKATISMATLNKRVEKLPELAGLKDGDLVTIFDDGKVTDQVWQGTYVYHPAGSKITPDHLYARWKDGLVAIHLGKDDACSLCRTNKDHNHYFATYMEQTYAKTVRREMADDPGIMLPVAQRQVTKRLITEPTDSAILRIPENAFLFRAEGNGVYTALTDVFVFKEGSSPVKANKLPFEKQQVPYGDQPLGVMFQ